MPATLVQDWSAVAPNSVAALILDAACSGGYTRRHPFTRTADGDYRITLSRGWMLYSPGRHSLTASATYIAEEDDRYPVQVEYRTEYRASCTAD